MPNITDLINYTGVPGEVKEDRFVNLTRRDGGEYATMKIKGSDKSKATIKLLANLESGEKSAREEGWLSADDVEAILGLC